jgi:hypothetical protein
MLLLFTVTTPADPFYPSQTLLLLGSIQQWITEAYNFPISPTLLNKILVDFKLDLLQIPHKCSKNRSNLK